MYDSSIQKSSKHNSTAKKVNITKRNEYDEDEEEYIGLMGSENFEVMGKKKRANKDREGNNDYEEDEILSDNDGGQKYQNGKYWTTKRLKNRKTENMQDQFHNTASPTQYKNRRGTKKTLEQVSTDMSLYEGYEILRVVGIKQMQQADKKNLGQICKVEWVPREGKRAIEPSLLMYEDVRRLAPK